MTKQKVSQKKDDKKNDQPKQAKARAWSPKAGKGKIRKNHETAQVADGGRKLEERTEMEVVGRVREMFAYAIDEPEKFYRVPDENGYEAIFRAQTDPVRFKDKETGQMVTTSRVCFYLVSAEIGNPMHALPECAKMLGVPKKAAREGEFAKRPFGMTDEDVVRINLIAKYLSGANAWAIEAEEAERNRAIETARAEEQYRKQRIAEIRQGKEKMIATEEAKRKAREEFRTNLALFVDGKSGRYELDGVKFLAFKNEAGVFCARPLEVAFGHPIADELDTLLANRNKYMKVELLHREELPKIFPAAVQCVEGAIRAFHKFLRGELSKAGHLDGMDFDAPPVVVYVKSAPRLKAREQVQTMTA
jgi:hypothetical protein